MPLNDAIKKALHERCMPMGAKLHDHLRFGMRLNFDQVNARLVRIGIDPREWDEFMQECDELESAS